MRLLVVGASGQVGGQLLAAAAARGHEVAGTRFSAAVLAPPSPLWRGGRGGARLLDITCRPAVFALAYELRPDAVLLPAAFAHVDGCEADPMRCRAVNVEGTRNVADASAAVGAALVFLSTAHAFGHSERPHAENDAPAPVNEYSRAKVAGEVIARANSRHLIVRTDGVFGPDPNHKHFAARVWRTLAAGRPLRVPSDQWGQPTYGPDLAATVLALLERQAWGTWHVCGPELLRRDDFARRLARLAGLDESRVEGVPTAALGQAAPRPLRVELCRQKLLSFFGSDPIRPALDGAAELLASPFSPLAEGVP